MGQCCKKYSKNEEPPVMDGLRSVWKRAGELSRLPKRDEHLSVVDALLAEVDFHIQELERAFQVRRQQEQKVRTGVDYSWLISETPRVYKIPQLERLELEELCLKLEPSECSKVVSMFRDATLREPKVEDLARIMRCCVLQTIDNRPRTPSMMNGVTEWVTRRTSSLASLKLKPTTRVGPGPSCDEDDIEMQTESVNRSSRAFSMPTFTVTSKEIPAIIVNEHSSGAYPV